MLKKDLQKAYDEKYQECHDLKYDIKRAQSTNTDLLKEKEKLEEAVNQAQLSIAAVLAMKYSKQDRINYQINEEPPEMNDEERFLRYLETIVFGCTRDYRL